MAPGFIARTAMSIDEGIVTGVPSVTALSTGPAEAVVIPSPAAYSKGLKTKIAILPRHIPAIHLFFCILFSGLTSKTFFNSKDC